MNMVRSLPAGSEAMPYVRHLLIELTGCNASINEEAVVRGAIAEIVEAVGAELLEIRSHIFAPQGLTAFALLSESHFSIHCWPECGYAAADLLTCGERISPLKAIDVLKRQFEPRDIAIKEIQRQPAAKRDMLCAFGCDMAYRYEG
jgi:S-adenosylmethionine decarboxylase